MAILLCRDGASSNEIALLVLAALNRRPLDSINAEMEVKRSSSFRGETIFSYS